MMEIERLSPLGARVRGLEVDARDAAEVQELAQLLAEVGVLILPEQSVDDDRFLAFLHSFGEMAFTKGETPLEGFPDLNLISNVGRSTPPRSSFHVDTSYVSRPPAYTALRAVEVPERGGETVFSDQYAAAATLPPDLRQRVQGRSITHVVTGVELDPDDEAAAEHPILRPHPLTGQVALYLTTPARCAAVSGLPESEGRELVEELLAHSTREENLLRHSWRAGDVVIWDNGSVLHKADHSGVEGDRVMHRGMVATYPGVALGV